MRSILRLLTVFVAAVMIGLWLDVGQAIEPRRDAPWGDWIVVCRSDRGSISCDYREMIGRKIQPDESDLWAYQGELTSGAGSGFNCHNSRSPTWLDEGPDEGAVLPGICRFQGSLLVRCYSVKLAAVDARGQCASRPMDFVANEENGFHIEILRPAMDREIQLETLRDHGAIPRRSPPLTPRFGRSGESLLTLRKARRRFRRKKLLGSCVGRVDRTAITIPVSSMHCSGDR